jgi:hypothetical protein
LPGDVAAMVFQLEGEEAGRTFSPVEIRNNVLLYHKSRPGDDDERIVTARMLRFDTQTLHLIYLENLDGDPLLLESYCTMQARVHD